MPLPAQDRRFRWAFIAIVLAIAVAAMGIGGARHAIAQDPVGILKDLLKKKKDAAKGKDVKDVLTGKKKQLTNIPAKKGEIGKAVPNNAKGPGGNAIANTAPGNRALPKAIDT